MENLAYIAIADVGSEVFLDTDVAFATRDNVIDEILSGEIERPIHIVAFDPTACDVSTEIAQEVVKRAWRDNVTLTDGAQEFAEAYGVVVPEIKRTR